MTTYTDRTWADDLKPYIERWRRLETKFDPDADEDDPLVDLYLPFANEYLGQLSDIMGPIETSWTVSSLMDGYIVTLPTDCLSVAMVCRAGIPLDIRSEAVLDANYPNWRGASAAPTVCAKTPSQLLGAGMWDGTEVIYGKGTIPDLAEEEGEGEGDNPLAYLPLPCQMSPAFYVLEHLPVNQEAEVQLYRASHHRQLREEAEARLQRIVIARSKERLRTR